MALPWRRGGGLHRCTTEKTIFKATGKSDGSFILGMRLNQNPRDGNMDEMEMYRCGITKMASPSPCVTPCITARDATVQVCMIRVPFAPFWQHRYTHFLKVAALSTAWSKNHLLANQHQLSHAQHLWSHDPVINWCSQTNAGDYEWDRPATEFNVLHSWLFRKLSHTFLRCMFWYVFWVEYMKTINIKVGSSKILI